MGSTVIATEGAEIGEGAAVVRKGMRTAAGDIALPDDLTRSVDAVSRGVGTTGRADVLHDTAAELEGAILVIAGGRPTDDLAPRPIGQLPR